MNRYSVKEVYYTLQGEGAHAGRPAVFLRFSGCNLWSGREEERASAICRFCDTDFVGMNGPLGGRYSAARLAETIESLWPAASPARYVVCTGGEPLLQLDEDLIDALHSKGFQVGVETNGTLPAPNGVDWICVSPKAATEIVLRSGDELKLVVRQEGLMPEDVDEWTFDHFFLQPMDGPCLAEYTAWAVAYCLAHPTWKLSLQTHKLIGIP